MPREEESFNVHPPCMQKALYYKETFLQTLLSNTFAANTKNHSKSFYNGVNPLKDAKETIANSDDPDQTAHWVLNV